MEAKRIAAALAYVPLALVFFSWALIAGAMTRGPAGLAALCVVGSLGFLCAAQAARVVLGRSPIWGAATKSAVVFNFLLACYFLIAIPFLRSSFHRSDEAATLEGLNMLRSATGKNPPPRLSMLVPKPLKMLPRLKLPRTGHPMTREVVFGPASAASDRGVWLYDNNPASPGFGTVIIDCSHPDLAGNRWSSY